jgi:hypothetical protein
MGSGLWIEQVRGISRICCGIDFYALADNIKALEGNQGYREGFPASQQGSGRKTGKRTQAQRQKVGGIFSWSHILRAGS